MSEIKIPVEVKLHFLGGAKEVGGSAILIELNGYRLLLDCGISKEYPLASIYATVMTIDLTRGLLYDSIKLMNKNVKNKNG